MNESISGEEERGPFSCACVQMYAGFGEDVRHGAESVSQTRVRRCLRRPRGRTIARMPAEENADGR